METTTGQCPPEFIKNSQGSTAPGPAQHSMRTMLDKWYLIPVGNMEKDEAFVCLCCCFPIYEKFLRASGRMKEKAKFNETHKVFDYLGKEWGCSRRAAFKVWTNWRNGLLHKAMVRRDADYTFFLSGAAEFVRAVTEKGTEIIVNPWKLRDCLFNSISDQREMWKDDQYPFMRIYEHG